MRVSDYLDLEDDSELLGKARDSWPGWTEADPRLKVVEFDGLRRWLQESTPAAADEVLHALVALAAKDGADDHAAAALMAWALLPGARSLVFQLRSLPGDVELLVASQLWIEIRSFPWRRLHKVAANILMNTRAGCLREAGAQSQVKRTDRLWADARVVSPVAFFWDTYSAGCTTWRPGTGNSEGQDAAAPRPTHLVQTAADPDPTLEVEELLTWGCEHKVIEPEERQLIECLIDAAGKSDVRRVRRANGGLTASEISRRVAPILGVSEATIRRRARKTIRALANAVDEYVA